MSSRAYLLLRLISRGCLGAFSIRLTTLAFLETGLRLAADFDEAQVCHSTLISVYPSLPLVLILSSHDKDQLWYNL